MSEEQRFHKELEETRCQIEKLRQKISECEDLNKQINPLTSAELLLKKVEELSGEIDRLCLLAVQLMENSWLLLMNSIKDSSENKFGAIVSEHQSETKKLRRKAEASDLPKHFKEAFELKAKEDAEFIESIAELGNVLISSTSDFFKCTYFAVVQSILRELREKKILSENDIKILSLKVAGLTANSLIPYSGVLLEILNFASKRLLGKPIDEELWKKWNKKMKLKKSRELLNKSVKKALLVEIFYNYHLSNISGMCAFA